MFRQSRVVSAKHDVPRAVRHRLAATVLVVAAVVVGAIFFWPHSGSGIFFIEGKDGAPSDSLEGREVATVQYVIDYLNATIEIPYDIAIVIAEESSGPEWQGGKRRIVIPPTFLKGARMVDGSAGEGLPPLSENEMATGIVAFGLFHEAAHALIAGYDLPLLGWEEDAADTFAVVALSTSAAAARPDVKERLDVIKAQLAMAHYFMSKVSIPTVAQMWGAHSINKQRANSIACLIYGGDPVQYEPLTSLIPETIKQSCKQNVELFRASWAQLLSPYFKKRERIPGVDIPRGDGRFVVATSGQRQPTQEAKDAAEVAKIVSDRLNELFVLPRDVTIAVESGDSSVEWKSDQERIVLPVDFVRYVETVVDEATTDADDSEKQKLVMAGVAFALTREAGKAFIAFYRLPVVSWIPDAVDIFATIAFSNRDPFPSNRSDSVELAAGIARLFAYLADQGPKDADYWTEQSLPGQRNAATLCILYGSDPKGFPKSVVTVPADERDNCETDFNQYAMGWAQVLAKYRR